MMEKLNIPIYQVGLSFRHGLWIGSFTTLILLIALILIARADWYGTAALGQGRYFLSAPENPAWCQHGFECREGRSTTVWAMGIGHRFSRYIASELIYHDFGKYTQLGAWGCNDDESVCGPTTYGYSEARTRGISLSAMVDVGQGVYVRAGALRWRSQWHTYMTEASNPSAHRFADYRAQTQYGWSPEIGLGIRRGAWGIELTRFAVIKPHDGSTQGIDIFSVIMNF